VVNGVSMVLCLNPLLAGLLSVALIVDKRPRPRLDLDQVWP
jgi:hypothetical protein